MVNSNDMTYDTADSPFKARPPRELEVGECASGMIHLRIGEYVCRLRPEEARFILERVGEIVVRSVKAPVIRLDQ